ncbi:MAG: TIGR03118 family protein [Verrucomicrobiota bacterium]|nr:TIGR03118 family protein [Verrucomicrobiota bacterium]
MCNTAAQALLDGDGLSPQTGPFFGWVNLTSDIHGVAANTDANLVNPWGLAHRPLGGFWIADNGTDVSTVYNAAGKPQPQSAPLVVTIPPSGSGPTGIVFNYKAFSVSPTHVITPTTDDFAITANSATSSSVFIFVTENGTIAGWSPQVDATNAVTAVDNSASAAVYKGVALSFDSTGRHLLYAANFHAGTVAVFDNTFTPTTVPGGFVDATIPAGFAPFNIKATRVLNPATHQLDRLVFVTYAKQDADASDDVPGPGNGYVNVFDPDGNLKMRLVSGGDLNSPWGLARTGVFGKFKHALLVGNFGDGKIHGYDLATGAELGALQDREGNDLQFDGLWALHFGRHPEPLEKLLRDEDDLHEDTNLYFTAGIGGEEHGLFGRIRIHR